MFLSRRPLVKLNFFSQNRSDLYVYILRHVRACAFLLLQLLQLLLLLIAVVVLVVEAVVIVVVVIVLLVIVKNLEEQILYLAHITYILSHSIIYTTINNMSFIIIIIGTPHTVPQPDQETI